MILILLKIVYPYMTACANNIFACLLGKEIANPLGKLKRSLAILPNYYSAVLTPIRTADLIFSAVSTYKSWVI